MKYKVKFRLNSQSGKKAKYSINIEEGAVFTMEAGSLGLDASIAPSGMVICLLKVKTGQLFASPTNPAEPFRHNNHASGECPLRPGDFIERSGIIVEFLEVPVIQALEDDGRTRFVDISEQKAALSVAAAPAPMQPASAPAAALPITPAVAPAIAAPAVTQPPAPVTAAAPAAAQAAQKLGKRELRKLRKKKRQQKNQNEKPSEDISLKLDGPATAEPEVPEPSPPEGLEEGGEGGTVSRSLSSFSEPPVILEHPDAFTSTNSTQYSSLSVSRKIQKRIQSPYRKSHRGLWVAGTFVAGLGAFFLFLFKSANPPESKPAPVAQEDSVAPTEAAAPESAPPATAPLAANPAAAHISDAALPPPARRAQDDFFAAIKTGDIRNVQELVDSREVDPNFTLERGQTPLMVACAHGQLKVVDYFVSQKVSLDARDPEGSTALMWAVHRGHGDVVEYLLKHGADPSIQRDDGDRAIDIARRWNQVEIVNLLRRAEGRDLAGQNGGRRGKKYQ